MDTTDIIGIVLLSLSGLVILLVRHVRESVWGMIKGAFTWIWERPGHPWFIDID